MIAQVGGMIAYRVGTFQRHYRRLATSLRSFELWVLDLRFGRSNESLK